MGEDTKGDFARVPRQAGIVPIHRSPYKARVPAPTAPRVFDKGYPYKSQFPSFIIRRQSLPLMRPQVSFSIAWPRPSLPAQLQAVPSEPMPAHARHWKRQGLQVRPARAMWPAGR